MKLTDFDATAVTTALAQMNARFHTRDVSEHRARLAAHSEASDRNYHAMVGSYLSQNRGALGLRLLPKYESSRGTCLGEDRERAPPDLRSPSDGHASPAP